MIMRLRKEKFIDPRPYEAEAFGDPEHVDYTIQERKTKRRKRKAKQAAGVALRVAIAGLALVAPWLVHRVVEKRRAERQKRMEGEQ